MSLAKTCDDRRQSAKTGSAERHIEALVTHHYSFIWRLLRRFGLSAADAEDAAQQVFMIAARKIDRIATERARSFLYATAVRVAANHRRGQKRHLEAVGGLEQARSAVTDNPERRVALSQACALLDELLAQLPPALRRVVVLADVEELEVAEVAALEGIPRGTAASRLRRGRQQFSKLLEAASSRNPLRGAP
jgi:RNA polymerase sigma-70 factor (ECF subfamily)